MKNIFFYGLSIDIFILEFVDRYGNRPNLGGIELMNEPKGVNLDILKKYYKEAYDAVRKHSSSAYAIMSNPLDADSKVILSFVKGFDRVVIDVHYYNLYSCKFNNMNAQQNIDFIREDPQMLSFVGKNQIQHIYFYGTITNLISVSKIRTLPNNREIVT